jgi:CDP-6-deoxy-D-xylo-4-hexulose-3-dehydrase
MREPDKIREEILKLSREYYQSKFGNQNEFIPEESVVNYAGRVFDESEMVNLIDSSLDFWLTAGRYAEEFEYTFAEMFDAEEALLVNSGSSANLVAISSLTSPLLGDRKLNPGDEVITVAAGFPTTVAPIIQNGLIPVFVDISLPDYNINIEELEKAISDKTKAIFIAHTLGNPWDVDAILKIAKKHNLWLVEDNCDALGSRYNGRLTGTFGDIATFSFYPAHHITMGEGGCVVVHDETLARAAKSFRDWGRDCYCGPGENNTCGLRFTKKYGYLPVGYDHKYVYSHVGYNLKLTDMQAAIGLAQLKKLNGFVEKRKENFKYLYDHLKEFENYFILPEATKNADPAWFSFIITLKEDGSFSKNQIIEYLEGKKIETRNLFAGNITRQPGFMNSNFRKAGTLKNTDLVMNNTFFLGVYPGLDKMKLDFVISTIKEFISKHSNASTKEI